MKYSLWMLLLIVSPLLGCSELGSGESNAEETTDLNPWWDSVKPIVIDGNAFYGRPCSVTKVSKVAGSASAETIFTVPNRLLTYCANSEPNKNYLAQEGEYVVLHVDRQTVGAGAWTAERYRSLDFISWEEYIGVTWVDGVEHEAWRKLGSSSSEADSRTEVVQE